MNKPALPVAENGNMFLLEGTLTDITISQDTINLLKQLKVNSTTQNVVTGIVGAVAGAPALAANAAFLENYTGETVENIACQIAGQPVIGQFSGANLLKEGDQVKAVVAQEGEVLLAHAILRPQDQLLWLPLETNKGSQAELKKQLKSLLKPFGVVSLIALILMTLISSGKPFPVMFYFLLVNLILFMVVGFWSTHDRSPLTARAEQIFNALGFPDVENLDMTDGSYADHHQVCAFSVYYYQCVLDAHREGREVVIGVPPRV